MIVPMTLATAIVAVAVLVSAQAATIIGRVIGVSDVHTITVLDAQNQQHKIRLAEIDAPGKAQAFGQASKKHLSDLVFGRDVAIECGKTDRYRREVCVVIVSGKDANHA